MSHTYTKYYYPYISPFDPCKPMIRKSYPTPPQMYLGFQPPNLPQYDVKEALYRGTLWPALYSKYDKKEYRGDFDE